MHRFGRRILHREPADFPPTVQGPRGVLKTDGVPGGAFFHQRLAPTPALLLDAMFSAMGSRTERMAFNRSSSRSNFAISIRRTLEPFVRGRLGR